MLKISFPLKTKNGRTSLRRVWISAAFIGVSFSLNGQSLMHLSSAKGLARSQLSARIFATGLWNCHDDIRTRSTNFGRAILRSRETWEAKGKLKKTPCMCSMWNGRRPNMCPRGYSRTENLLNRTRQFKQLKICKSKN